MDPTELTCVAVVVLFALIGGIALIALQRLGAQARERAADHLAETNRELLLLIDRLSDQPHDEASVGRIRELTKNRAWVPGEFYQPSKDLWGRALQFAFSSLDTATGQLVAYQILVPLAGSVVGDEVQLMRRVHEAFATCAENRSSLNTVMNILRALAIRANQRQWLYDRTLDLLQRTPSSAALAVLALEVGRWHLGRSRPGGAVTIYDEQAIQNDMAVRRGPQP